MKRIIMLLTVLTAFLVPSIANADGPVPAQPQPQPGQFVTPSVTRSGVAVPLTDGGVSSWSIGSTGWTGVADQNPASSGCSGVVCSGNGYQYANNNSNAWNSIAVCGAQLVTGGWQLLNCAYSPPSGSQFTNFTVHDIHYDANVCGRWYTTYVSDAVLVTGGWQYKSGMAPGIQRC
jgi:hypothetical protein